MKFYTNLKEYLKKHTNIIYNTDAILILDNIKTNSFMELYYNIDRVKTIMQLFITINPEKIKEFVNCKLLLMDHLKTKLDNYQIIFVEYMINLSEKRSKNLISNEYFEAQIENCYTLVLEKCPNKYYLSRHIELQYEYFRCFMDCVRDLYNDNIIYCHLDKNSNLNTEWLEIAKNYLTLDKFDFQNINIIDNIEDVINNSN